MATHATSEPLSELEREAEHTRADLIHTVDQLHSRVSPRAIKEEMKAYARDSTTDLLRNLEQKARENPLAAAAAAAGLAYPAWRFLISIPAPILLAGAGIALSQFSRSTGGRAMRGRAGTSSADALRLRMRDASSDLSRKTDELKEGLSDAAEQAKSTVNSGLDAISQARSAATNAANSARDAASDTLAAATDTVSQTYRSGVDIASRAEDQVSATLRESKESLLGAVENHPFIVGGIGLAIGAIIASALPVTQAENRLLGGASDELKNRAANMASEGVEMAKTAAGEAYHDAVSRVQEQGLNPDTVRETVKSAAAQARNVAQQAADALGEQSPETNSPSVVPQT